MKTNGLFTIHSWPITVKHGGTFRIVPFGDVHWDSPLHAKEEWKAFLAHAKTLKDAYFLGLGDYLDSGSTSERACLDSIKHGLHETTSNDLQELAAEKVIALGKELSFMKGRLIGLMNGNHYSR